MAKIRDCVIPSRVADELLRQLDEIPDQAIIQFGKHCLPGGFTKPQAIRSQLRIWIEASGPLLPEFVHLLSFGLPCRETIGSLSARAIRELFDCYAPLVGRERLILAMLVDEREEVHRFGAEQSNKPTLDPTDEDRNAAQELLVQFMEERFLGPGGMRLQAGDRRTDSNSETKVKADESTLVKEVEKKLSDAESAAARSKQEIQQEKERNKKKLEEQQKKFVEEKAKLVAECDRANAESQKVSNDKSALETELKQTKERIDAAIAEGVREQTGAAVRKWLAEPLKIEEVLEQTKPRVELVERAERLLELQSRQDRHTGNRLQLEERLKSLGSTRERVAKALNSSINPLPQLRNLLNEIEAELLRVQKTLSSSETTSQLASNLLGVINEAKTWHDLRCCEHLVQEISDYSLLEQRDRRCVYNALQRKLSLLEERASPKQATEENGWSLRAAIHGNKKFVLVIDGHNVLFCLNDIFGREYEDGIPRRRARQKLVGIAQQLVRIRPNVRVRICFDSPRANVERLGPNIEVSYSGGTGANRADEMITSRLQFKDLRSLDEKVYVVTDDRAIRSEILRASAIFVPNDLFAVLMADFHCLET